MKIQWLYLLLALAVMVPPMPFSAVFQKSLRAFQRRNTVNLSGAARIWQNWADLGRSVLGAYLLTRIAIKVDPVKVRGELNCGVVVAVILGVALLVQVVRGLHTGQLLGPVFFLSGLTLVLGGKLQGAFAVVVGCLFAIGGKNLTYQLPAMLVALLSAGYVLGLDLQLLLACVLIALPLILSALLRKKLIFAAMPPAAF